MVGRIEQLITMKKWLEEGVRNMRVAGVSGSARAYLLASFLVDFERPCLLILPNAKEAKRLYGELAFFFPEPLVHGEPEERRLYDIPAYDVSPLRGVNPHRDLVARRIQGLYTLSSGACPVVVTSVEAAMLRVLPKRAMTEALEYMQVDEEVDRDALIRRLEENGYSRTSLVEERGDYAVRGGVVDLFPPLYSEPVRLEFWGEKLESIRHFDPQNQRSREALKEIVILPANEIVMNRENILRARSMGRIPAAIGNAGSFPGQEAWLNHFYSRTESLLDYLPETGLLMLLDDNQLEKEARNFTQRFHKEAGKCLEEAEELKRPFPELGGILLAEEEMKNLFKKHQRLYLSELAVESASERILHLKGNFLVADGLDLSLVGKGRVSMAPLAEKVTQWKASGARVVLVCRTEQQAHRLAEILGNYHVAVDEMVGHWTAVSPGRGLSLCLGRLSKGFAWPEAGLYVISEDEIFGPKRGSLKMPGRMQAGGLDWTAFSQLKLGDLVVHEDHGIGRYGGLQNMEIEEKTNDFVIIEYADEDRLYVPADRISVLQKYIGADEDNPKLDRLGGRSWDIAKKKAKRAIREIARQLVEISALRKYRKGFAYSRSDSYYKEFEATFEHEETPDQVRAIGEVLDDMESERPMDRLVCGDVGFGKTEVAIRASFKAVMDGKQVAVLVPTTVLAEQHYETFVKRMAPYAVSVAVLSRFKSRREQKEIVAAVRSGKIDILIGTHRILQKDVSFRDLGLLIIDEEQRFGVRQKEAIKKYRALVDVLALTATPIPRTLHMALMGIRDLSLIETPPEDRLAIQTYLSPFEEGIVVRGIEYELQRGGQVFFVHNRVQTIGQVAQQLKHLLPRARIAIAHGQMKERALEETMIRFVRKEIDVLVCTTIIESGLDIPSVNTIVINEVDRFGLAQIYQLRGRVGRSDETAYAFLLLSKGARLAPDAEKRLRALMDFSHLGAGLHLAMHDLKIRGGGNILGFSQSGHISAIGYELYLKLIEQNIAELKGEEWHEEINPEINVNLPAYISSDYVSDTDVRLNLYRRLSNLREEAELDAMVEEMRDRFGTPPPEVSNLVQVVAARLALKRAGILKLDVTRGALAFTFSEETCVDPQRVVEFAEKAPNRSRLIAENKLLVRLDRLQPLEALLEARKVTEALSAGLQKSPL
jgi:transcription-repair coupling factor (superfamily II helicase)